MCPVTPNLDEYSTQPLPTPTPTYENIKSCGRVNNGTGQGVFTYAIRLDNSPKTVTFKYNTYSIPDRFIIELDDSIVADTGYVGDTSYDESLAALGLPSTSGIGQGSITFLNPKNISIAYLTVYAPLPNSSWSFFVECATPAVTPSNTQTITYTATPSQSLTPTPTATPVTNIVACGTYSESGPGRYTYRIIPAFSAGTFSIAYNTYSIPDKFTVTHGSKTYTTGFVGDTSYNSDLEALGLPSVSGPGIGSFTFAIEKNVATFLVVDAPLTGTVFSFTVICPTPTPTITGTPLNTPSNTTTPTPEPTPFKTSTPRPTSSPTNTPQRTPCPTSSPTNTNTSSQTPTSTSPPMGRIIVVEATYNIGWEPIPATRVLPPPAPLNTPAPYDWTLDGCGQRWSLWGFATPSGFTVTPSPGRTVTLVEGSVLNRASAARLPYQNFVEEVTFVPAMPAGGAPYTKGQTRAIRYFIYLDRWARDGGLAPGDPIRWDGEQHRWWMGGNTELVDGVQAPTTAGFDFADAQGRRDASPINIAARMFSSYTAAVGTGTPTPSGQLGGTQRIAHPGDMGEAMTTLFNIQHMPGTTTFTLGVGPG